jgi:hypothetical protein
MRIRVGAFANSMHGSSTSDDLVLEFADYATQLNAHEETGVLRGTYGDGWVGLHDIELRRNRAGPEQAPGAPDIGGLWPL